MKTFHFRDKFRDSDSEQQLLAAIAADPLHLKNLALSSATDLVVVEKDRWVAVRQALRAGAVPEVSADWTAAKDPIACAERLRELHRWREIADTAESLNSDLRTGSIPASEVVSRLDENLRRVRRNISAPTSTKLVWAPDLLAEICVDVEARRVRRLQDPHGYAGVPTGIHTLDKLLHGLQPAQHVLAGPPGVGKTTAAQQIAERAPVPRRFRFPSKIRYRISSDGPSAVTL